MGKGRVSFGITLPIFHSGPLECIEVALAAEEAGLDGVFVFDHFYPPRISARRMKGRSGATTEARTEESAIPEQTDPESRISGPMVAPDCFVLLGGVAAVTKRVRVGPLVARSWLRPPAVTARALASLHEVAPERVIAGLGIADSYSNLELEAFGVGLPPLNVRLRALERTIDCIRRIESELATRIPIWIGGCGPSLRAMASKLSCGVNLWNADAGALIACLGEEAISEVTWGGDLRHLGVFGGSRGSKGVAAEGRRDLAGAYDARRTTRKDARRTAAGAKKARNTSELVSVAGVKAATDRLEALADSGASWIVLGLSGAEDLSIALELVRETRARLEFSG
jgi:alkanesulfonate monooxygenase SsuD/methylene tetrahydromethanopterin reductase-like flavin-dependent oxidoreductase (luciferase family)